MNIVTVYYRTYRNGVQYMFSGSTVGLELQSDPRTALIKPVLHAPAARPRSPAVPRPPAASAFGLARRSRWTARRTSSPAAKKSSFSAKIQGMEDLGSG